MPHYITRLSLFLWSFILDKKQGRGQGWQFYQLLSPTQRRNNLNNQNGFYAPDLKLRILILSIALIFICIIFIFFQISSMISRRKLQQNWRAALQVWTAKVGNIFTFKPSSFLSNLMASASANLKSDKILSSHFNFHFALVTQCPG